MGEFACFPMERGPAPDQANTVGGWIVTSWFGGRVDPITGRPGNHGGEDLAYSGCHGAPFYAVKPGRVSQGWDGSGGGNWTSLFCDDGDYVGYGHALSFAPGVNGRHVQAGTLLGYVDSTGGSTGAHMHLALNVGGRGGYDDPHDYLVAAANAGRYPGDVPPDTNQEDEMTPAQMDELKKYIDAAHGVTRDWVTDIVGQTADADRAHMAAVRDQGCERLEAQDGALVKHVERVRDEALAVRPLPD